MAGYAPLPAYQAPNALNFQPLSQGIDDLAKGIKEGRANALNREIGQAAASGDWKGAQNAAFGGGQIDQGMGIAKFQQQNEAFKLQQEDAQFKHKRAVAEAMGGAAQYILKQPPEQRGQLFNMLYQQHPELKDSLQRWGQDPNDHQGAASFLVAQASKVMTPLEQAQLAHAQGQNSLMPLQRQALQLDLQSKQRELDNPAGKITVLPDGASAILTDPRSGKHNVIAGGQGANGESSAYTKARDKELGEARAKALTGLPAIADNANRALSVIEEIRNHPGRATATGLPSVVPPLPGTEARGFVNLVDQAKGQTFLEAFNSLRGGGAITEAEGQKATQALARLDRGQRGPDFDAALTDLAGVISTGAERAKRMAAGNLSAAPVAAPQQKAPAANFDPNRAPPGTIHDDPKWGRVRKGDDGTWYPVGAQ